jgi:hypothetical protein
LPDESKQKRLQLQPFLFVGLASAYARMTDKKLIQDQMIKPTMTVIGVFSQVNRFAIFTPSVI